MINPEIFDYWLDILCQKHEKRLTEAFITEYIKAVSRLSTEEFDAAARQAFAEDDFFPMPKRINDLGKLFRAKNYFSLAASSLPPLAEDLTAEELQARKAAIARIKAMMGDVDFSHE
jgi:hypothetical protein